MGALKLNDKAAIASVIKTLEDKAAQLRKDIYADHHGSLIRLRETAQNHLKESGYSQSAEAVSIFARNEKQILRDIKKQDKKMPSWVLELTELDMQIDDYKRELTQIEHPEIFINGHKQGGKNYE